MMKGLERDLNELGERPVHRRTNVFAFGQGADSTEGSEAWGSAVTKLIPDRETIHRKRSGCVKKAIRQPAEAGWESESLAYSKL
jgi:hypothetical protein